MKKANKPKRETKMLTHYKDLYYNNPQNEFERSVNSNLNDLCISAQQSGWQAIRAQERLKKLKSVSKSDREAIYQVAIEKLKT